MAQPTRKPSWRLLERLRYQNHSGRVIRRHRALRKLDFERSSLLHPILVLSAIYTILIVLRNEISTSWQATFSYWLPQLGFDSGLELALREFGGVVLYRVPYPALSGAMPTTSTFIITLGVLAGMMLAAFFIARRSYLPLGYLLWGASLIVLMSAAMFYWAPQSFQHSIATHVHTGLEFAFILIFFAPLILSFSFLVFDHGLVKKLIGTTLVIGSLIIVAPYQYLLHVVVIEQFSLIVMPLMHVLFGLLFDVAVFVAVYAWVVSWEP